MAYEYEEDVLSELTQIAINERNNGYFKIAQEIEEVYRKAKVFDEINIILDEYLGDVEDELNALNLIREKLEGMEDE